MKTAKIFYTLFFSLTTLLLLTGSQDIKTPLFAEELDSTNFKMIGVTTSGGGGILESTNYNLISTAGQTSADPRNYSTNYRINQDPSAIFTAIQPSIQCFETDTDGTTDCTTGPAELLSGGMVAICGPGGCHDKARFEINPYENPSDTLYMIQISTDEFASEINCIDASTFYPKDISLCDISDFRTETYWETEVFNTKGLKANTQYFIRTSALHGDFTQSDYSIEANATTAMGEINFDIDIALESGTTTETTAPYSISFTGADELVAGAATTTASNLIWLDIDSSSTGGVAIIQFGEYGGLYSPTTGETILSNNENLDDTNAEGFGLQNYYIDYLASDYLGEITTQTDYAGINNVVGEISTNARKIYDADGPITDGRVGTYLKARSSVSRTPSTDYSENIFFTIVPRY